MKKWKAAGLITVAGACVIAIVWGLHGRTKNNAKLLQLDEQVSDDSVIYVALGDSIIHQNTQRMNDFLQELLLI